MRAVKEYRIDEASLRHGIFVLMTPPGAELLQALVINGWPAVLALVDVPPADGAVEAHELFFMPSEMASVPEPVTVEVEDTDDREYWDHRYIGTFLIGRPMHVFEKFKIAVASAEESEAMKS